MGNRRHLLERSGWVSEAFRSEHPCNFLSFYLWIREVAGVVDSPTLKGFISGS